MESMGNQKRETGIYDVLRRDILDLRLRPGMLCSIKEISEVYGVGRTPVRDALISLSKEGLITFLPQSGTIVSRINYNKIKNERFLRICVEENVMLEFMSACDLDSITDLELSIDRQKKLRGHGDIRGFIAEDQYFHSVFYSRVNRGYCHDVLESNSGHYRRLRLLSLADFGIEATTIDQHRKLVDAAQAKDAEQMKAVLDYHLNRLVSQERTLMGKYPELFEQEPGRGHRELSDLGVDFLVEAKLRYHA